MNNTKKISTFLLFLFISSYSQAHLCIQAHPSSTKVEVKIATEIANLDSPDFPTRGLEIEFDKLYKEDPQYATAVLETLQKRGIRVYISTSNDYGIGRILEINHYSVKLDSAPSNVLLNYHISRLVCLDGTQPSRKSVSGGTFTQPKIGEFITPPTGVHYEMLSPTESFFSVNNRTYIVWRSGPQKGRVYQILQQPSNSLIASAPTAESLQAFVDQRLYEMQELRSQIDDTSETRYSLFQNLRRKRAELLLDLHALYDGQSGRLALSQARFYNSELNFLLLQIENIGLKAWLIQRKKSLGLKFEGLLESDGDNEMTSAFENYFYGERQSQIPPSFNVNDPVILIHGTYGNILGSLISAGGLKSDGNRPEGLMKLNGEGGRGSSGYTPSSVSFWYYQNGNPFPSGGHARARSFEFPMAIGINRSQVSHLQASGVGLYHGSMHGEVTIENQVKWSDITHVFVPSFKVAEVTQILRAHGIVHVKVFPLAHGKSEEAI